MTDLYAGSVLWVDLARGVWRAVPTERYVRASAGGHGLGVSLLFESDAARGGVRSGGRAFCLAAGAFAGTVFPGCGSADVTWLAGPTSPPIGHVRLVGGWAAELKQAGWDAVVLEGRAERPVYLYVRNDRVELRDAGELWGATCGATEDRLRTHLDSPDARVACIGPAGEEQTACATLHGDLGAAEGDPGAGAALGAMDCKAVVVRGTGGVRLAHPTAFLEVGLAAHEAVRASSFHRQVHRLEAQDLPRAWRHRRAGCSCCPVSCRDSYDLPGCGGAVLPREARAGLWPELRRRAAGLWFELVRQCLEEGVDAWCAAATAQRLAASGELELPAAETAGGAPVDAAGREAVRRLLRVVTERAQPADVVWRGGRADHAGARDDAAAAAAGLVGACERLAGAEGDPLGPDSFAAALAAGLGRPFGADELLRAAERTRRLESTIAWNVHAARPAWRAPAAARAGPRASGRRRASREEVQGVR